MDPCPAFPTQLGSSGVVTVVTGSWWSQFGENPLTFGFRSTMLQKKNSFCAQGLHWARPSAGGGPSAPRCQENRCSLFLLLHPVAAPPVAGTMHWEQAHRQPVLKEVREEHPLADTSKNRALLVPLSQSGVRALKLVSPAVLSQGLESCPTEGHSECKGLSGLAGSCCAALSSASPRGHLWSLMSPPLL